MVDKGDHLSLRCVFKTTSVAIELLDICRKCPASLSRPLVFNRKMADTDSQKFEDIPCRGALKEQHKHDQPITTFHVSRNDIWRLNDMNYNKNLCYALTAARDRLNLKGGRFRLLVDAVGLPIIALQALRLGAEEVVMINGGKYSRCLRAVANANGLNAGALQYRDDPTEVGEEMTSESDSDESEDDDDEDDELCDIFVLDLIDEHGALREDIINDASLAR